MKSNLQVIQVIFLCVVSCFVSLCCHFFVVLCHILFCCACFVFLLSFVMMCLIFCVVLLKECWFCRVSEEARQSAWDNIVTCHHGDKQARTWSFQRKCIGAHHLKSHAADNKAGPVMVCRLPVFCYRNNKMIRLQHFSITCGLLNSKVDHQMCFLLLSIQSSPGPPSVQLLPSNCLVVWTVHNDLITVRQAVVGGWEEPPNIWLTVAENEFVGWALNFRVHMLLKGAVIQLELLREANS